jgi:hypothetical protein
MDRSGAYPTSSETRLLASPVGDWARIDQALNQAEAHAARMQPSPATEHLTGVLASFRRVMEGWSKAPPTDEQLQALRERVEQALRLARTTSPTLRIRRQA